MIRNELKQLPRKVYEAHPPKLRQATGTLISLRIQCLSPRRPTAAVRRVLTEKVEHMGLDILDSAVASLMFDADNDRLLFVYPSEGFGCV